MTINGAFKFTNKNTSVSTLNLSGGRIEVVDLIWQVEGDNGSSLLMDVTGGMMVLNGDRRAVIQEGIDKGFLVAYGGKGGTIVRDYDEVANITTITAKHELNPIPADGGLILPNNAGQVTLEWTLLDPCSPGSPTRVDVYVTDDYDKLFNFLDPESIRVVNGQSLTSVTVPVGLKKEYYWAVDSYLNNSGQPKLGPIFRFYVDHARPEVDAGANITTFLQDGIISGPLVGTATDDGVVHALTVEWSVLSQPDDVNAPAVIAESTALETSITMTAAGTYVLQLQADDGEYKSTDTLTITVFGDIWNIED
jgi:hypothetical protein